ncbi:FtsZ/tubulin family protein [Halostella salina]|uniref:hypothetical protein n=1 Tax=Halostella salina TaxID=1547897 RepID=UPI000EF805CC|nr:hypothetical protein [Halostella salina]
MSGKEHFCPECGEEFDNIVKFERHKVEEHDADGDAIPMGSSGHDQADSDPDDEVSSDEEVDSIDDFIGESSEDTDEETTSTQSTGTTDQDSSGSQHSNPNEEQQEIQTGNKWYLIGVGGAGSGVVDATLLRRESLDDRSPRTDLWDGAIQGQTLLDTNQEELGSTYYIKRDSNHPMDHVIGQDGDGAGESPFVGRTQMWQEISSGSIFERFNIEREALESAQALLLVHSIAKGTGTGATGLITQLLHQIKYASDDEDEIHGTPNFNLDKPILTTSILPDPDDDSDEVWNDENKVNSLFGLGTLGRFSDLAILFDNNRLKQTDENLIRFDIGYNRLQNNPDLSVSTSAGLQEANKALIHYLEVMSMTSNPEYDAPRSPRGLDVPDLINPPKTNYPISQLDFLPAVIGAPVLYSKRGRFPNRNKKFIRRALNLGQLIDFDPGSAWGGAFIFYGSKNIMDQYEREMQAGIETTIKEVLREDFDAEGSLSDMEINVDHTHVPEESRDRLYLWGLMWNPKMPRLEQTAEEVFTEILPDKDGAKAKLLTEDGDSLSGPYEQIYPRGLGDLIEEDEEQGLRPYVDQMQTQLSLLGRENKG